MPKNAQQPHWRQRRVAIGKKSFFEAEILMDSEVIVTSEPKLLQPPASPTSVASIFEAEFPEIQPLPGAWQVVGKGGRPLKSSYMYDEPVEKPAKKKRNRTRKPATTQDEEYWLPEPEDASSSSSAAERRAARREKAATSGKEARFWARYREAKGERMIVHEALLAALSSESYPADEDAAEDGGGTPQPLARRANKGTSRSEKMRRKARLASQAARCYSLEDEVEERAPSDTPKIAPPRPRGREKVEAAETEVTADDKTNDDKMKMAGPAAPQKRKVSGRSSQKDKKHKEGKSCSVM